MREFADPILCGFVWKHGENDFSAWSVEISAADRDRIEEILMKYDADGFSVRNCYDEKFSEVF